MFPFNTDGIDPSGARYHIYNITCQNYDDVVVPKPEAAADCTRDFLVENCTVFLGVGMTVGSVPPDQNCNCVKNITFRNVRMVRPLKGIYVKTNPGD
jgi:polygalacturonase